KRQAERLRRRGSIQNHSKTTSDILSYAIPLCFGVIFWLCQSDIIATKQRYFGFTKVILLLRNSDILATPK
ncbi:MAG: hypothetical protein IKW24_02910, partial [Clostridia bacterium]|nr:hypothetical protein [Clostridia bacterium]